MPAPDDGGAETDAADALSVVAHELRLEILRALWAADNHSLSFSDLRSAVGVRDAGQFNYHLSQLTGRFVAHVEDRYELLYPGHRVVDAIQSGVFHRSLSGSEVDVPGACPDCGGALVFTYEEFIGRIECLDCEATVLGYPFDPGGFEGREDAAVGRAFDRRTRRYWLSATDGVCPVCAGPTDARLVSDATTLQALDRYDKHFASEQPALAATDCRHCSFYSYVPPGVVLLSHPAVVGALYDRGVDVRGERLWTLSFVVDADRVALASDEPRRVTIVAGPSDEPLEATVGADAAVDSLDGT
jgi:hypothetical protein